MKKTIHLFLLLFLTSTSVFAQFPDKIYASPEELKEMTGRTLLVALYDVPQKDPKPTEVYNELIQKVVKERWTLNSKVEFKSMSEISKLMDAKDKKYTLLLYNVLHDVGFNGWIIGNWDNAPTLQYQRCEKKLSMRDHFAYFPYVAVRPDKCLNEGDIIFTVESLQKCIRESIGTNKQLKIVDYFMGRAKANCDKLKNKEVLCDNNHRFQKLEDQDIKENYSGKFSFVSTSEIDQTITSKSSEKYATIFFVYGIFKGAGGAMLLCCKLVYDPSTDDLVYFFEPGGMGSITDNNIRAADLKRMEKCKFK